MGSRTSAGQKNPPSGATHDRAETPRARIQREVAGLVERRRRVFTVVPHRGVDYLLVAEPPCCSHGVGLLALVGTGAACLDVADGARETVWEAPLPGEPLGRAHDRR